MKKVFFTILALLLSASYTYSNEYEAAKYLANKGIIVNFSSEEGFRLNDKILRQEVTPLMLSIADLEKKNTCNNVFKDVSTTIPNNWACYTIEQLADNGLIALNKNFRPEDYITKAEAVGMIIKATFGDEYQYSNSSYISWQEEIVEFAVKRGIIQNFTDYNSLATRGFVFEATANAIEAVNYASKDLATPPELLCMAHGYCLQEESGEIYTNTDEARNMLCELLGVCEEDTGTSDELTQTNDDNFWRYPNSGIDDGDNVNPGMGTTNSQISSGNNGLLISSNYFGGEVESIPTSGIVDFGIFYFSANGQDITLDSVQLKREGLGSNSDIRRIHLEQNGERVTNRANVGVDGLSLLTFNGDFIIKQGVTAGLTLMAELSDKAGSGNEHRFSIRSASDVYSNINVSGEFPIKTGLKRITSYTTSVVEISRANQYTTINGKQNNVLFTEFRVSTSGDKNYVFQSLTLRNIGTASIENTLSNFKLTRDGKDLSYNYTINGRDVIINFYDLIPIGRAYTYQLRADIYRCERVGDTYEFEIRSSSDVGIVEEDTGFTPSITIK